MVVPSSRSLLVLCALALGALSAVLSLLRRRRELDRMELALRAELEEAKLRLAQGRTHSALSLAAAVPARAHRSSVSHAAWHVVAWAELELGRPRAARVALAQVPLRARDAYAVAAVEVALGHGPYAVEVLEQARAIAPLHASAAKLLIDSLARLDRFAEACAVAEEAIAALDPADTRRVIAAARARNCHAPAARLAAALCQRTGASEDALGAAEASKLAEIDGAT